jgi:hypothetical protein
MKEEDRAAIVRSRHRSGSGSYTHIDKDCVEIILINMTQDSQ